jgi:hypothetical protein
MKAIHLSLTDTHDLHLYPAIHKALCTGKAPETISCHIQVQSGGSSENVHWDWLESALCILVPVWNCSHSLIKTRIGSRQPCHSQWIGIAFIAFRNRNWC